jgi:hypothetical protein
MAIGTWTKRFPNSSDIAKELEFLNPSLTFNQACKYAAKIVYQNDDGHFAAAYKTLYSALRQKRD